VSYGEWWLPFPRLLFSKDTEYKLAICDKNTNEIVRWETGGNHRLEFADISIVNLNASSLQIPFKASGVAVPVFSLRSEENYGVGEFPSLKKMVDWAALTGQKIIQILPINDTTNNHTWRDSYPYNAISIYALHPVYLGLDEFPLKDEVKSREYRCRGNLLNGLPELDYEQVMILKTSYLDDLFSEMGEKILSSEEFRKFVGRNKEWLFPYACYSILRDFNKCPDFHKWLQFSRYNASELEDWIKNQPEIKKKKDKIYFTQYLLDKQLTDVRDYARSHGVILKGDIPIGVNPYSVDAWTDPQLFNLDTQTGAPPDDFAVLGQNWGFPTYNWDEMAKDGYAWWKKRFSKMADYFDAYRIDHILGFFRIWEIPCSAVHALLGYFSPALPFSKGEIEAYGFHFDEESMISPSMLEKDARSLFGGNYQEAFDLYLLNDDGNLRLRNEFATQAQIETYFSNKQLNGDPVLKEQLLLFCDEVLFVRDKRQPDRFHPRISSYLSKRFAALDESQRSTFSALYEDFYYHRHNEFWKVESMKKLPELLRATAMLACGEDLGMIPACVPQVMKELDILSLEIERMPKSPNVAFEPLHKIPFLSVCTTSTHDMSPIRLWWTEDAALTQRYFNEVLWKHGNAPAECLVELCEQVLVNHLASPAMLVVLPLQDWMSIDERWRQRPAEEERINVPANSNHYWRYRMHWNLEDLMKNTTTNGRIRKLVRRRHITTNR
jgi:4-alpha-glucanotransferase